MKKDLTASFTHAMRLRCLYCGETSLLPKGGWFQFAKGCEGCGYDYQREVGYFSGAFQMVLFTVISLSALFLAFSLKFFMPSLSAIWIVVACSTLVLVQVLVLTPWAMALWMWVDHRLNPLPLNPLSENVLNKKSVT